LNGKEIKLESQRAAVDLNRENEISVQLRGGLPTLASMCSFRIPARRTRPQPDPLGDSLLGPIPR
jgi:hypothetical protein